MTSARGVHTYSRTHAPTKRERESGAGAEAGRELSCHVEVQQTLIIRTLNISNINYKNVYAERCPNFSFTLLPISSELRLHFKYY